jgi:hypothetical protein
MSKPATEVEMRGPACTAAKAVEAKPRTLAAPRAEHRRSFCAIFVRPPTESPAIDVVSSKGLKASRLTLPRRRGFHTQVPWKSHDLLLAGEPASSQDNVPLPVNVTVIHP